MVLFDVHDPASLDSTFQLYAHGHCLSYCSSWAKERSAGQGVTGFESIVHPQMRLFILRRLRIKGLTVSLDDIVFVCYKAVVYSSLSLPAPDLVYNLWPIKRIQLRTI
jgi:hypothetical protein